MRNLSEFGIVTDIDPYNLPPSAYSGGVNVRFAEGGLQRAPVFRNVDSLAEDAPRYLFNTATASGFDTLILGYLNGKLSTWGSGTEADVSISGYTPSTSEAAFTHVAIGNVVYVNREDRVPWFRLPTDATFTALSNWNSGWRAKSIRACGGALVALGVTKSSVEYPTMVKTSEFATYGAVPTTWDETDPTNNATENVINEMDGPIIDGWPLGDSLYIFGRNETWQMQPDGSGNVFSYTRRFKDAGLINTNCVVEVDSKHYVFGTNDIWMHDGTSKASICTNRVRNFIFRGLNTAESRRFFVRHNPTLKEIYFCYVSGDRFVGFTGGTGCNRAAVFNYSQSQTGTWTFYDLPYVFAADLASVDTTLTYAASTQTYETIGSTYLDQEDSLKKTMVMIGGTYAPDSLTKALYAFDLEGPGSTVSYAIDTNATLGWQLERDGLDLDEIGANLRGYKVVNSLYPQARLDTGAEAIEFSFGSADYFNEDPVFSDWQTYDGSEFYKLDYYQAGRYLSMRMRHNDTSYINISGIDFDLDVLGER